MGAEAVRVLVVDDSPVDRRVVELLLRAHCGGGGGAAAGEAAPFHAIDIVLTDYCMPEMTGYDLLKAIKALGSPNPIPVVVMSSENEPQRISRCLTAGAEDFILKPLKMNDVQRLRKCSGATRPKSAVAGDDDRCCNTAKKAAAAAAATPEQQQQQQRSPHLAGLAMA
uniref:Response regulatory domain-containing protein n=1 Tax=Oryza nivara TaxID=4536 RepID=A0A0E0G890_ORYNI